MGTNALEVVLIPVLEGTFAGIVAGAALVTLIRAVESLVARVSSDARGPEAIQVRSRHSRAQVVLADLVEELAAADAQALGGLGAVAVASGQARARSLGLSTSASRARSGTGSAESTAAGIAELGELVGVEVLGKDRSPPRGDCGPCQGVFQLPDVAGPGSLSGWLRVPRRRVRARPSRAAVPLGGGSAQPGAGCLRVDRVAEE